MSRLYLTGCKDGHSGVSQGCAPSPKMKAVFRVNQWRKSTGNGQNDNGWMKESRDAVRKEFCSEMRACFLWVSHESWWLWHRIISGEDLTGRVGMHEVSGGV